MPVSSVTEHWIKQDAIIINLNHFGDPDYLQVSVLAGAVVMAFKQDVIGYNAARNYRTWPLQAANTFFETTDALNVYARLTRSEVNASALIIYDPLLRDIEGRSISYADDGSEVLGEADEEYYYIYLGQISSSINADGNEIEREWSVDFRFGNLDTSEQNNFSGLLLEKMFKPHYEDKTNPNKLTSIEALAGLWTDYFLSSKGKNPGGGSDEPTGGATTLGGLRNVAADADRTYDVAKMLVLEAKSNLWTLKNLSELVGGLDETELADYLTRNEYAKKADIPSLSGYATESWVLSKGYLTEHQDLSAYAKKADIPTKVSQLTNDANYATTSDLDARIDALVNGAPAAYDTLKEIADVLAGNVNSISDILTALGNKADKATTLSGYGITDAYTIAQIDSIVNGLSGNISTLQGYFTDGVANRAKKLATARTIWGQSFDGTGDVSGDLSIISNVIYWANDAANYSIGAKSSDNYVFHYNGYRGHTFKTNAIVRMSILQNGNVLIGTTTDSGYKLDVNGETRTTKLVIGNGSIEWDETNKGFKIVGGLYTESYLSAKGANTNGGSSSGGGLIESLWKIGDLGKTFNTNANDTFNAYAINAIHNRVSVLEGKATNVSFTQSLTSGTQIGTITIDGASKNIYAPTIPTSDINKGVTAYGWGNHASVGYLLKSGGTMTGNLTMGSSDNNEWLPVEFNRGGYKGFIGVGANQLEIGSLDGYIRISPTNLTYLTNNSVKTIIHSSNYTDYTYSKSQVDSALGGYLPLSGGIIRNSVGVPLVINNSTVGGASCINFRVANVDKAQIGYENALQGTILYNYNSGKFIGVKDDGTPVYSGNTLWHSGNFIPSDYLPLSGGDINGYIRAYNYRFINNSGTYLGLLSADSNDENTLYFATRSGTYHALIHSGNIGSYAVKIISRTGNLDELNAFEAYYTSFRATGVPKTNYVGGITFQVFKDSNNDFRGQIAIDTDGDSHVRTSVNGTWNSWKQIAYTTSNVASATKLQTARTIWGQSFDGTGDVSGDLSIISNVIYWANDAANYSIGAKSSDNYVFHYNGYRGHTFKTNAIVRMSILQNGNVLIGTTTDNGYKLDVVGDVRFSSEIGKNSYLYLNRNGSDGGILLQDKGVNKWQIVNTNNGLDFYDYTRGVYALTIGIDGVLNCVGTIHSTTGIWSDGYVSAKGQNTSSDMRLKNVLNEVVLGVKDIANAPSIRFSWKNGGGVDVGSSAQYWQGLLPDAVKEQNSLLEMQYGNIALLSAIAIAKKVETHEERIARVETHEERIARLEKENRELRNEIMILKGGNYA